MFRARNAHLRLGGGQPQLSGYIQLDTKMHPLLLRLEANTFLRENKLSFQITPEDG